jgi:hypothetical protein
LMLAHQFTEQLPKEVLSAILKNVQTWVLFGLQADDARLFAGYMGLKAEDFQNLPPYHTYQRTIVGNTQTGVYSARPLPPPPAADNPGAIKLGDAVYAHVDPRRELSYPAGRRPYGQAIGSDQDNRHASKAAQEEAFEALRDVSGVHALDDLLKLVRGSSGETDQARRSRLLKLATNLYGPAEEGDEAVVDVLSLLARDDQHIYRWARHEVLDAQERQRILAQPQLVPDKARRIERLSALRWGTPCVEVEALIRAATRRGNAISADIADEEDEDDESGGAGDGGKGGKGDGPEDDYGSPPARRGRRTPR